MLTIAHQGKKGPKERTQEILVAMGPSARSALNKAVTISLLIPHPCKVGTLTDPILGRRKLRCQLENGRGLSDDSGE